MLATIAWFHTLRLDLELDSVAAVQAAVEPTGEEQLAAAHRRWRDYHNGRRAPSGVVVDLAEELVPGSRAMLASPLWDALRLDKPPEAIARRLIGTTSRLGDELLQWILGVNPHQPDPRWLRKRGRALVRHANLEALAILTVGMRLAGQHSLEGVARNLYQHAADCLLVLGSWFYAHGIAQPIAELYEQVLLPACCREPWLTSFSSAHYLDTICRLNLAVMLAKKQAGKQLTEEEILSVMLGALAG